MKRKLMPVVIGLGILGLAGCGNGEEGSSDNGGETDFGEVLATSDAGEVTVDDILNEMGSTQVANQTFQLVLNQILQDKYSDDVDEAEIEEQVDAEIEQYGGEEQFEMMMAQQQPGMTAESFKQQRIDSAYHNEFFTEEFDITDEEAMENAAEGSHILIAVDEESEDGLSEDEALEKAEELITEIEDGADFAEVAEEESDDGSAQNGGSLGLVTEGQMVPEFEEALFNLEQGEMTSEPVQSQFGYHIIQRGDGEDIADEEVQAVKSQLINQKVQENPDQVLTFYQELLEEYNVSFENDEIQSYIEETYMSDSGEEDSGSEDGEESDTDSENSDEENSGEESEENSDSEE